MEKARRVSFAPRITACAITNRFRCVVCAALMRVGSEVSARHRIRAAGRARSGPTCRLLAPGRSGALGTYDGRRMNVEARRRINQGRLDPVGRDPMTYLGRPP